MRKVYEKTYIWSINGQTYIIQTEKPEVSEVLAELPYTSKRNTYGTNCYLRMYEFPKERLNDVTHIVKQIETREFFKRFQ